MNSRNILVVCLGEELEILLKLKCAVEGSSISEVARGLLAQWVARPDLAKRARGRPRKIPAPAPEGPRLKE